MGSVVQVEAQQPLSVQRLVVVLHVALRSMAVLGPPGGGEIVRGRTSSCGRGSVERIRLHFLIANGRHGSGSVCEIDSCDFGHFVIDS